MKPVSYSTWLFSITLSKPTYLPMEHTIQPAEHTIEPADEETRIAVAMEHPEPTNEAHEAAVEEQATEDEATEEAT